MRNKQAPCPRWAFVALLAVLIFLFAAPVASAADIDARAAALDREIRCVVCQSESIAESQASVARDLRKLVREKIADGWNDDDILAYLARRYGDFILLKPPVQPNTYLLWLFPVLFLGLGGGLAFAFLRRRKT